MELVWSVVLHFPTFRDVISPKVCSSNRTFPQGVLPSSSQRWWAWSPNGPLGPILPQFHILGIMSRGQKHSESWFELAAMCFQDSWLLLLCKSSFPSLVLQLFLQSCKFLLKLNWPDQSLSSVTRPSWYSRSITTCMVEEFVSVIWFLPNKLGLGETVLDLIYKTLQAFLTQNFKCRCPG